MVNTDKLRGIIAERGMSQARIAKILGVTPKTFYLKMGRRVFDSDEIELMATTLGISRDQCADIFFAPPVT